MSVFFNILIHALIIIGVLAMFGLIVMLILSEGKNWLEKIIKTAAVVTGFLIYLGAKAIGISIPGMILASVQNTNPIVFGLFGLLLPAAAGVFISWYCIRSMRQSDVIASRIVLVIAAFITVMFGDVYAVTAQTESIQSGLNQALLPNLTFIVGLALYVIFKYEGKPPIEA